MGFPVLSSALDNLLRDLDDPDSEVSKEFERSREKWSRIMQPLIDRIAESERLTAEDLATRVTL